MHHGLKDLSPSNRLRKVLAYPVQYSQKLCNSFVASAAGVGNLVSHRTVAI